jgi:hypothetical protein
VNFIESGSALAVEAETPDVKSKASAIVPRVRIVRYSVASKRYGEAN